MTPEVDRLIRECQIFLAEDARTLHWTSLKASDHARIRALKPQIIARLVEIKEWMEAGSAPPKSIPRIVTFTPPDTLEARTRPAEQRLAQAVAWVEEHHRERHEPRLDWTGTHVQVVNQRGEVLARPVGLLPELALLLHVPEPYDLPMIPTMRGGGQRKVA